MCCGPLAILETRAKRAPQDEVLFFGRTLAVEAAAVNARGRCPHERGDMRVRSCGTRKSPDVASLIRATSRPSHCGTVISSRMWPSGSLKYTPRPPFQSLSLPSSVLKGELP